MAWYDRSGQEADVVLSSRVRVARNLEGYAFEPRLTADKAKEIIDKAKAVFTPEKGYTFTDFAALSPVEREAYAERYTVSAEFAAKNTPHALISKEDDGTYIMVCEEDHLRIQSIVPGFDLKSAYKRRTVLQMRGLISRTAKSSATLRTAPRTSVRECVHP